jgi:hypothetical protein
MAAEAEPVRVWTIVGSYFEVCNCEAICPCRRVGERAGGRSTVEAPAPVACGIPGFDRPGQEVIADTFRVSDAPLSWDLHGRCGFATDFSYSSCD